MSRLAGPGAGSGGLMTRTGSAPGEGAVLDESFDAATLHLLRARGAAYATAADVTEDGIADIVLAVHGLAAHDVRHGPGCGRLLMRAAPGVLCCQVSDTGPGPDS